MGRVENLPKPNKWGGPNKPGGWKMGFGIRKTKIYSDYFFYEFNGFNMILENYSLQK